MATVKETIDEFLSRINEPTFATYVGSTEPAQRQYLSLLRKIGDNLRNRPHDWPQLKRSFEFSTVAGQARYELPGDFYRLGLETFWDKTNQWPLRGPITDFSMAFRNLSVVSLQTRKAFRLIGPTQYLYSTNPYNRRSRGYIELSPTPDGADTIRFDTYISASWVWPRDWAPGTAYQTGDLRTGIGQIYRCVSGGTSGTTRPSWTSGTDSDGGVDWEVYNELYTWQHDDDLILFDEDLMIEGLKCAYLQSKGLDYVADQTSWESMVSNAIGRFGARVRVNAADQGAGEDYEPNVPDGSWPV